MIVILPSTQNYKTRRVRITYLVLIFAKYYFVICVCEEQGCRFVNSDVRPSVNDFCGRLIFELLEILDETQR